MPVTAAVELIPLKTTVYLAVKANDLDTAIEKAVSTYKVYLSALYQENVGAQNIRAEMEDPVERKDMPGVWDAVAVVRAEVPTTVRVLGAENYLDAWRQIVKTVWLRVTRELEDDVVRKGSHVAVTRRVLPGEEEQQEARPEKPKRMIQVTAIVAGTTHNLEINADDTILDGVLDQGVSLKFQCKAGVCDECKIHVLEGMEHLPPVNEAEVNMLGDRTKQNWRLSCQISCNGPIKFEQP